MERRKRLKTFFIIIVSCVAVWGSFWFLGQMGPQKASIRSQSKAGGEKASEDIYQIMSTEELVASSLLLEQEAQLLIEAGDYEAAQRKYQQALEAQEVINESRSQDSQSDLSRAVRLRFELQNAIAAPLLYESMDLEQKADLLIEENNTNSAVEMLNHAIAAQQKLNDGYRDSRHASPLRLRQLEAKLEELKSNGIHAEMVGLIEQGALLEESGDMELAGGIFEQAARLQDKINVEFPNSPYVSLSGADELRQRGQNVRSAVSAQRIQDDLKRLNQLLKDQSIKDAVRLIEDMGQALQAFEKSFPLSSLVDETTKSKIAYLQLKSAELLTVHNIVGNALVTVPGLEGVQFSCTEVPQSLYILLMNSNPSRNPAIANPVDSVSWVEAKEFCERLSWMLGREVRLPKESEFRQALGVFDFSDVDAFAWGIKEAKGLSQPIGQKKPFLSGCFDLLGNVSEWLSCDEAESTDTASHIGGHVQDDLRTIANVPARAYRKTGRSRMVGFRFVVLQNESTLRKPMRF